MVVGVNGAVRFVVDGRDDLRCAGWKRICLVVENVVNDAAVGDSLRVWLDWIRVKYQLIFCLVSQNLADGLTDWIDWSHRLVLLVVLQE